MDSCCNRVFSMATVQKTPWQTFRCDLRNNNWLMVESNPAEKYKFVNWDDDIPNIWIYIYIWENKSQLGWLLDIIVMINIYIYGYWNDYSKVNWDDYSKCSKPPTSNGSASKTLFEHQQPRTTRTIRAVKLVWPLLTIQISHPQLTISIIGGSLCDQLSIHSWGSFCGRWLVGRSSWWPSNLQKNRRNSSKEIDWLRSRSASAQNLCVARRRGRKGASSVTEFVTRTMPKQLDYECCRLWSQRCDLHDFADFNLKLTEPWCSIFPPIS